MMSLCEVIPCLSHIMKCSPDACAIGADELAAGISVSSVGGIGDARSEEHTSELQSLMRISYAVFCLKKKTKRQHIQASTPHKKTNSHNTTHISSHRNNYNTTTTQLHLVYKPICQPT